MGNELSTRLTLPDAENSHHLLEATTFDHFPLDNPRELGDFMWALYKKREPQDPSLLDESIQATQNAVDLEQEQDDHAQLLFDLGVRLDTRSELTGSLDDLEKTISAFQSAVELTPDGDPNQIVRLHRLGSALIQRFKRIGDVDELDAAITVLCCAVELAPDTDPEKPALMSNHGISLLERFQRLGELEDIECAIAILRHVDELVSEGNPDKPKCSYNLGNSLMSRFERTGQLEDLEQAISSHRRAVELTPDGHPDKPLRFNYLGSSFLVRFQRAGQLEDIERAISMHSLAVELTPDGHPDKPSRSDSLGNSFLRRFERTGELEDLKQAISSHRCAVELTPDGHPDKPARLNNLGNSFITRFDRTGELEVLEQAISSHRCAVELTPDGHPHKAKMFNNLGGSLIERFECTGELEDLEEAISEHRHAVELAPDGHPEKPSWLSNLGSSFRQRFERTGKLEHLEEAISTHRRAVELAPNGHPGKLSWFSTLGISFHTRFERTGDLEDLEQAISTFRRAVELAPDGHPNQPSWFSNLGNSFLTRFQRTGELEDLKQAISLHRRAVELTPDGHPGKSSRLNNLGNSLMIRSKRTGELEDHEQSILSYRQALELTADDHPQKRVVLKHLCHILCSRFKLTQVSVDIQEAISAGNQAIALCPEGHPNLSRHYNALAECFQCRFEHSGDLDDIRKAVSLLSTATEFISDGDPQLSSTLKNLGSAQRWLFEHTQNQADFDVVVESCARATVYVYGSPSDRFDSARCCVHMLSNHPSFSTTDSLLSAHSRIIAILPEIVWLGHDIHRRYEESSQLGELVNAAVSAAITAGALTQAVEWLEAGRAIIWAQVLALRTPLDELQDSRPELAKSLLTVQKQLQSSAHSSFAHDFDASGSDGLVVNPAADRHRALVIEYDKLMKSIRACPGFEDFLRPRRLESLLSSPGLMSAPIVFINVHTTRCDAIVVSPSGSITAIPLLGLSLKRAAELQRLWTDHVTAGRARMLGSTGDFEGEMNPLKYYLRHTWTWIVQPILEGLDLASLIENDRLPHVIWCPTGPLVQLPLHAAGIYDEPHGPRTYDFVVSSYTPSLSALARSFQGSSMAHTASDTLIVTQPSTPGHMSLPGTVYEGTRLRDILMASGVASKWLNDEVATVHEVRNVMEKYPWVHLACHGSQNREDVTQSAFHLYDGSLTLTDLMGTAADNAELAFLSACQTATGDAKVPEESAHLAAGMLAVGFKGVIATMWSIQDADAPIVVEAYYKELLGLRSSGMLGKGETGAAYALHEATRVLRERVGEDRFLRWVPFVHFGI